MMSLSGERVYGQMNVECGLTNLVKRYLLTTMWRKQADDKLDLSVGLDQFIRIGNNVEQGDPLLRIHSSNDLDMERAKNLLSEAFQFSENPVESNPLILESVT